MVKMAMGVDDPLHIGGIEAGFPDGMDQHGCGAAVAAVDQQQAVTGIDQVNADPAVTHIPDVTIKAEGMNIPGFLVKVEMAHGLCQGLFPLCHIQIVLFFHSHGEFLL